MIDPDVNAELEALIERIEDYYESAYSESARTYLITFLAQLSPELPEQLFQAHIQDASFNQGRRLPLVSDFQRQRDKLEAARPRLEHPQPDEAWALAELLLDERRSAITTTLIVQALGPAREILTNSGEREGMTPARMAFRATYQRLLRQAEAQKREPELTLSLGSDPEERERVLMAGAQHRLVSPERLRHLLPNAAPQSEATPLSGPSTALLEQLPGEPRQADQASPALPAPLKEDPVGAKRVISLLRETLARSDAKAERARERFEQERTRQLAELNARREALIRQAEECYSDAARLLESESCCSERRGGAPR